MLIDHAAEILADHALRWPDVYPQLKRGGYYYHKATNDTMRFDGWAMQLWDGDRVCWTDVPNDVLEEVTWGCKAIPLQDFSDCEHY